MKKLAKMAMLADADCERLSSDIKEIIELADILNNLACEDELSGNIMALRDDTCDETQYVGKKEFVVVPRGEA